MTSDMCEDCTLDLGDYISYITPVTQAPATDEL